LTLTPTLLAAGVVPRISKIIKNNLHVFERGENSLQMVYYTLYLG